MWRFNVPHPIPLQTPIEYPNVAARRTTADVLQNVLLQYKEYACYPPRSASPAITAIPAPSAKLFSSPTYHSVFSSPSRVGNDSDPMTRCALPSQPRTLGKDACPRAVQVAPVRWMPDTNTCHVRTMLEPGCVFNTGVRQDASPLGVSRLPDVWNMTPESRTRDVRSLHDKNNPFSYETWDELTAERHGVLRDRTLHAHSKHDAAGHADAGVVRKDNHDRVHPLGSHFPWEQQRERGSGSSLTRQREPPSKQSNSPTLKHKTLLVRRSVSPLQQRASRQSGSATTQKDPLDRRERSPLRTEARSMSPYTRDTDARSSRTGHSVHEQDHRRNAYTMHGSQRSTEKAPWRCPGLPPAPPRTENNGLSAPSEPFCWPKQLRERHNTPVRKRSASPTTMFPLSGTFRADRRRATSLSEGDHPHTAHKPNAFAPHPRRTTSPSAHARLHQLTKSAIARRRTDTCDGAGGLWKMPRGVSSNSDIVKEVAEFCKWVRNPSDHTATTMFQYTLRDSSERRTTKKSSMKRNTYSSSPARQIQKND